MENEFKINKSHVEVLNILGLSTPEVKVFLSILLSKSTIPLEISELSGISKNKIYSVFKSLTDKGFLYKSMKGYEIRPESLNRLKSQSEEIFRSFGSFLEKIVENYPVSDDIAVKKISYVFQELGYDLEFNDRLNESLFERISYRFGRSGKSPPSQMPWFIVGSSPTSGRKVGIIIAPSVLTRQSSHGEGFYLLRDISVSYQTDILFIVAVDNFDLPEKYNKEFLFFSILSDYDKRIIDNLENFDRKWQQTKETLSRLENRIEEPYKDISRLTTWLGALRYEIKELVSDNEQWLFKSFEEITDRIDSDLKTDTDICLNLKFNFKKMQSSHRYEKIIPSEEEINTFINQITTIKQDLERLSTETGKLYDEINSVFRENIYKKHGYIANPFVFTIPVENHLDMVGQSNAMSQLSKFIENMNNPNESDNVVFIVDEPGMGKTHLMKYYLEKMNKENFANSLGIFIRCKTGTDLLSIYSQIQLGISQLDDTNMKNVLLSILKEKTQPLTINELTEILREISHHLYQKSKKNFFLFIDEFENMIPTTSESKTALLQLRNLVQTPHVGFVIVLRRDIWEKEDFAMQTIPDHKYHVIQMEKFDTSLTKLLLEKRLLMFSQIGPSKIIFDDDAIGYVTEKSKGNIRHTITLARDAFRLAIRNKVNIITPELLKSNPV